MKLISLNVWGGRLHNQLIDFLNHYKDVDFFCFQEVYHQADGKDLIWLDGANFSLHDDILKELVGHQSLYHPHLGDWWGLALYAKENISIDAEGEVYVHKEKNHEPGPEECRGHTAKNIQYLQTTVEGKQLTIINFHGLWNGQGKEDSDERLEQSRKIIAFLKTIKGEFILTGDFNLSPNTESLILIERECGLRNLIREHSINSTRTSFYTKENRFADYTFVSKGITVHDFRVLPDEVSDHAPLLLDFSI
jgi:endonuclease/exonuclease/phosphatase family metal-dependent hydrolase